MKNFIKNHKIFSTLIILMLIAVIFFVSVILIHIYWYRSDKTDKNGFIDEIKTSENGESIISIKANTSDPGFAVSDITVDDDTMIVGQYDLYGNDSDKPYTVKDLKEGYWLGVKYKMFNKDEILWIKVIPFENV